MTYVSTITCTDSSLHYDSIPRFPHCLAGQSKSAKNFNENKPGCKLFVCYARVHDRRLLGPKLSINYAVTEKRNNVNLDPFRIIANNTKVNTLVLIILHGRQKICNDNSNFRTK